MQTSNGSLLALTSGDALLLLLFFLVHECENVAGEMCDLVWSLLCLIVNFHQLTLTQQE